MPSFKDRFLLLSHKIARSDKLEFLYDCFHLCFWVLVRTSSVYKTTLICAVLRFDLTQYKKIVQKLPESER